MTKQILDVHVNITNLKPNLASIAIQSTDNGKPYLIFKGSTYAKLPNGDAAYSNYLVSFFGTEAQLRYLKEALSNGVHCAVLGRLTVTQVEKDGKQYTNCNVRAFEINPNYSVTRQATDEAQSTNNTSSSTPKTDVLDNADADSDLPF